jgi:hypothetical protein
MKKLLGFAVAAVIACGAAQAAQADSLASPGGSVSGTYFGSGNPNTGWTVGTGNGIEVGLEAILRNLGPVEPIVGTTYFVPAGFQTQPSASTKATWNYNYSIDLRPGGVGSLTLDDIDAKLTITNLTTSASGTIDLIAPPTGADNASYDGTTVHNAPLPTDWATQNSKNPTFGDAGMLGLGYDIGSSDDWSFVLNVYNKGTSNVLATTAITVDVVPTPLPSAAGMGLTLVAGLGAVTFMRKRRASV